MDSLFGDFPESFTGKCLHFIGYFAIGMFFGIGPAVTYAILRHRGAGDAAWHAALAVWFGCALWTAYMGSSGRLQTASRFFSAVLCVIYIWAGYERGGAEPALRTAIGLYIPLLSIWFGDLMGGYTGLIGRHPIQTKTPGILVAFGGWLVLIGVPIFIALLSPQVR